MFNKYQKAYHFDYKYRQIDPAEGITKRISLRAKYTVEDSVSFAQDLLKGDTNAVMFKVAGNLKRQLQRLRTIIYFVEKYTISIKNALVEGFHHTVHGLKVFGKDSKWLIE